MLTGWRGAVALVLGLALLALLVAVALWIAVALTVLGAVVWLNLVVLPRISRRLRVPRLVLDIVCLALLAGVGWLLGGPTGVGVGVLAWVAGIAAPRVAGRRLRARLRDAASGPPTVIVVDPIALPRR